MVSHTPVLSLLLVSSSNHWLVLCHVLFFLFLRVQRWPELTTENERCFKIILTLVSIERLKTLENEWLLLLWFYQSPKSMIRNESYKLGIVLYACKSQCWEAESGRLPWTYDQLVLHSEYLVSQDYTARLLEESRQKRERVKNGRRE